MEGTCGSAGKSLVSRTVLEKPATNCCQDMIAGFAPGRQMQSLNGTNQKSRRLQRRLQMTARPRRTPRRTFETGTMQDRALRKRGFPWGPARRAATIDCKELLILALNPLRALTSQNRHDRNSPTILTICLNDEWTLNETGLPCLGKSARFPRSCS